MTADSGTKDTVFRFKQFELANACSSMRVGTDGVLLGAWADVGNSHCVWDIGTGTGLMALMVAQRCVADIYGVEIDAGAYGEASLNFDTSPWRDRLHAVHGDIRAICHTLPRPDMIVCNPPFFSNSMRCSDGGRTMARHEDTLSYDDVIAVASSYMQEKGHLYLVSPYDRRSDIEWSCVLHKLSVFEMVAVRTVDGKPPKRILWDIGFGDSPFKYTDLSIRNTDGTYSSEYIMLTKEYYLNF